MLITPERIRILRREAERLGVIAAVATCDRALVDRPRVEDERACLALADNWRAMPASFLVLDQIGDLTCAAIDADDWHAVRILRMAAVPDEHGWIPTAVERVAREIALAAWNARAERLQASGIPPWNRPGAPALWAAHSAMTPGG
jgi:hypothetical protein